VAAARPGGLLAFSCVSIAAAHMRQCCVILLAQWGFPATQCCLMTSSSLMCATAGGTASNVVDVYNSATGAWSTAQLSVPRWYLAAASVGNVALFAGGYAASALFVQGGGGRCSWLREVEFVRVLQYCGFVCPATASSLTRATAGGGSNAVDVYNSATGAWSTAQLSVARWVIAATSVKNVALFAGGASGGVLLCSEGDG
jgi:hypothetical protein